MGIDRNLISTSISIPQSLLERAKTKAACSYRTFSQYVSYLIDQDLSQSGNGSQPVDNRNNAPPINLKISR